MTEIDAPPCQIYLITPPVIEDMGDFLSILAKTLDAAPIACLQIRLKELEDLAVIHAVNAIIPLCREKGVSVIINDRPDLAKACGADGVHIGQDDMDYFSARDMLGEDAIIGVTCHDSRELAFQAALAGANYVAFGAFYDTPTKQAKSRAEMEILNWWNEAIEIPCVAIGGITPANAVSVIKAGADFIAVSSGVWNWPDGPQASVKRLYQLCLRS